MKKLILLGMLIMVMALPGTTLADIDPPECLGGGIQLNLFRDKETVCAGDTVTYFISASVPDTAIQCCIDAIELSWENPDGVMEDLIGGTSGNPPLDLCPGGSTPVFERTFTTDADDCGEINADAFATGLVQDSEGEGSRSNDDDTIPVTVICPPDCEIDGPDSVCEGATGVEYCSVNPADTYEWAISGDAVIVGPTDGPCVLV
ncbi:MAG: hypothetical protein ACYSSL_10705, partial [Planctomycetota bacterium]